MTKPTSTKQRLGKILGLDKARRFSKKWLQLTIISYFVSILYPWMRFCDTLNYVDVDVGAATEENYGVHAGHRNVNGKKNAWCMWGGGHCVGVYVWDIIMLATLSYMVMEEDTMWNHQIHGMDLICHVPFSISTTHPRILEQWTWLSWLQIENCVAMYSAMSSRLPYSHTAFRCLLADSLT